MTQSLNDTVSIWHSFFMPQYLFGGECWSVYMTQSLNDTNQWRPYMTQCLCDTVPIWHSVFVPQSQYDTMHKRLYMTLPSLLCLRHIDTVSYRYCVIKNSVISTLCHKETVSLRHVTVQEQNKTKQGISALKDEEGNLKTTDEEKANILNNYFASVYTTDGTDIPNIEECSILNLCKPYIIL